MKDYCDYEDDMVEALEFYADPKNWYRGGNADYSLLYLGDRDPWDIAAKALEDD